MTYSLLDKFEPAPDLSAEERLARAAEYSANALYEINWQLHDHGEKLKDLILGIAQLLELQATE